MPEIRVRYANDPNRAVVLMPPRMEEIAQYYPLDLSVTQFLTESDQRTIKTPESACKGPNPLDLGSGGFGYLY